MAKSKKTKTKKTKSEIKKDRVAAANKARQTMIDKAIAEHEAKKKQEKAKRKTSAKRVAAAKKARQTMIDNAIAEYEAKKKRERANKKPNAKRVKAAKKARQTMIKKEVEKAERKNKQKIAEANFAAESANRRAHDAEANAARNRAEKNELQEKLKKSRIHAGARAQGSTALWLALTSLIFAIIYFVLYALVNMENPVITGDAVNTTKICYTIFYILMMSSIIGSLTIVSPLWGTLSKEYNLTAACAVSLVFIWLFSAFAIIMFIINILIGAELITIDKTADNVLSGIALASPIILTIFSGVLYGSISNHYPKYRNK